VMCSPIEQHSQFDLGKCPVATCPGLMGKGRELAIR
jgi:hypothetical protein